MPKRAAAAAECDCGNEEGLSLHKFPKNPKARSQWSREVAKMRSDWTGPSDHSVLCSLHFTKDSYEASVVLTKELGLPCKKWRLKDTATPTLLPKPADIGTGSMEWAYESVHYCTLEATAGSSTAKTRPAVLKRKRAKVCYYCMT